MPAPPDSLVHQLVARAAQTPDQPAYWKRGAGGWESASWREVAGRVQSLFGHLVRLGLRPGDRVAIMMPTTPEWEYCHLGALAAGGVVVGLDAHDADTNLRHILATAEPRALFLADSAQIERIAPLLPKPAALIVVGAGRAPGAAGLAELLAPAGAQAVPSWPLCAADMLATLVFTSGSTGVPKGVAYTHAQLGIAAEAILSRFPMIGAGSRLACWLPLSNLFQRIIDLCAMRSGAQSWFVDSPMDIVARLPEIRPALFVGVPRFYEKLHAGIQAALARRPAPVRRIVELALRIGMLARQAQRQGRPEGFGLRAAHALAERFVLRRLRRDIMGEEVRFMVSGSAPLPVWLIEWFHALGWLLLEAYGTSENVVPIAINAPDAFRFGSVGRALPQNEVRLAADGELLTRGPGVFGGYCGPACPDAPLDGEGFLHTGDYARIDEDGFIWLTGRKSEVFKTSTGRRVAPVPVESALKRIAYVEAAVVLGSQRPFPVALLCVDAATLPEPVAAESRLPAGLLARIARDVDEACAALAGHERPAAALVIRRAFSIDAGELTCNLKLRRKAIEDEYRGGIDALYGALAGQRRREHCLVMEAA